MSKEVWKDVAGYEGLYAVSDHGRVRSLVTDANRRARVLKTKNGGRYHHFSMCDGLGNRADAWPHRLVAQAFIPNPKGLPCVNHKDGNKGNNRADNLEWVTYAQNSRRFGVCASNITAIAKGKSWRHLKTAA